MLRSLFLVATLALGALSAPSPKRFRCGSVNPPAELVSAVQGLEAATRAGTGPVQRQQALVVNLYFHIVSTAVAAGTVTSGQIRNQLDRLSTAYSSLDISFNLVSTDSTTNDAWAQGADELGMKRALRKGTYSDLNVYFLSDLGDNLLGFCHFPEAQGATTGSQVFVLDGCVCLAGTLPGGNAPAQYTGGATAAHEIGHWFGLFHVFQGASCSGSGDSVADTPAQRTPTSGCPARKDSCPNVKGRDSISNYMDYSDDICMTSFTAGQKVRVDQLWSLYRQGK